MKFYWFLLPATLLMATPSLALETYCQSTGTRVHAGGSHKAQWFVVHPKGRRTQLPGQSKVTTGCSISYSSVGAMYRPIEIINAPKNGKARVSNTYRVSYTPSKLGPDELTIRIHWIDRGTPATATVRYSIEVVDQPL